MTEEYKIVKGVQTPPTLFGGRRRKYPFGDMEVGDAFSAPNGERHRVSSAASMYGRRTGKSFTTWIDKDTGLVWVRREA